MSWRVESYDVPVVGHPEEDVPAPSIQHSADRLGRGAPLPRRALELYLRRLPALGDASNLIKSHKAALGESVSCSERINALRRDEKQAPIPDAKIAGFTSSAPVRSGRSLRTGCGRKLRHRLPNNRYGFEEAAFAAQGYPHGSLPHNSVRAYSCASRFDWNPSSPIDST